MLLTWHSQKAILTKRQFSIRVQKIDQMTQDSKTDRKFAKQILERENTDEMFLLNFNSSLDLSKGLPWEIV